MKSTIEKFCGLLVNSLGHKDADINQGCLLRPVFQIEVSDALVSEMLEDE